MIERNQNPHRGYYFLVLLAGCLVALIGVLVLVGWYSHNLLLLKLSPRFVAMQFNTALCFLFSGIGLVCIYLERRLLTRLGGAVVSLVAGLTLLQYIFKIHLGIDQLFMHYYLPSIDALPGRMATSTAISFILVALSLLLMAKEKSFYRRSLMMGILGTVVFALGAMAFFVYIGNLEVTMGEGAISLMAFHTACCFMLLGIGIFLLGWREGVIEDEGLPNWLAVPIGIILLAVVFFQWQVLLAQETGTYILMYPAEKSPLPHVILGAGVLMAILITITIHQAKKLWNRSKIVNQANRELQAEIAERMRAEAEMHKSQEKYRLLADNTLDCIWRMNLDFSFTYINPSVKPMFGYSPEEWIGSSWKDHCSAEQFAVIKARINEELQQAHTQTGMVFETELIHKEGFPMAVEVNGKSLRNANHELVEVQGTIRDISERKKAEAEKEKLEELLRQAQKMEAIGTLAGGIAHDFNNILGVLMGYTELSIEELPPNSPVRHNLRQVMASAERAKEMVKQILAFSRKSQVERLPLYIAPIIIEALKLLRASLPTTIAIESEIAPEAEPVLADPTQIHQVIMNLCTNSAYAMKERGGVLRIILKTVEITPDFIDVQVVAPGRYRVIIVNDTGHGMDEETQKRIFEPYFTTKPMGEGTGMGLAVVHGIVKDHGGIITLISKPGAGASFCIYLPVVAMETKQKVPGESKKTWVGGTECILLVDDEQVLVEMVRKMLASLGYQVVSRAGSVEALEAFRSAPDKFQLVITDQTMPNMTGVHLAREIKKIKPGIPVILCTGFSESVNEENYKVLGVDAFVMKPIVKKHIAPLIREILDQKAERVI